jgi:hypothetical protein
MTTYWEIGETPVALNIPMKTKVLEKGTLVVFLTAPIEHCRRTTVMIHIKKFTQGDPKYLIPFKTIIMKCEMRFRWK